MYCLTKYFNNLHVCLTSEMESPEFFENSSVKTAGVGEYYLDQFPNGRKNTRNMSNASQSAATPYYLRNVP